MEEPRTNKPLNGPERPVLLPILAVVLGVIVVLAIFAIFTMI